MAATTKSVLTTVQGKVVVVTGGCSGLGLATAIYLNQRGAKLILLDINRERGEEIVASQLKPHTSIFVHCDVRDEDAVKRAMDEAVCGFGRIDVVVNNAGIMPPRPHRPLYDAQTDTVYPLAEVREVIEVNLIGMVNVLRLSVPILRRNDADGDGERGLIINTSSINGLDAPTHQLPYVLSKAAINGATTSLAHELAEHGIRVCTIAPGCFHTGLSEAVPLCERHLLCNYFPVRMGEGEEFAHLVASVIQNKMFNGANIRIDGATRAYSKSSTR